MTEQDIRTRYGITVGCCATCHDDADEWDYEMCHVTVDGEHVEVCCALAVAVKAKEGEVACMATLVLLEFKRHEQRKARIPSPEMN